MRSKLLLIISAIILLASCKPYLSDDALLDRIERLTIGYFTDYADPSTGMARERNNDSNPIVTTGGTGFGIMAIIAGAERGYFPREEGVARIEKIVSSLEKLDINTKYYIYIKAYCPTLEGQWVGAEIKTLNKVTLPFVEHFDAPYNKDNPAQAPNWTYGTSMRESDGVTMRSIPYLTNYRTESMWKNYSPNATPALEFAGAINAKVIPAGEYAYAASPEIDIDRIQDAYVDFWGTPYLYDREYSATEHYASGIIVGIMDNPADYSTFVPVDTCYAINKYKFDFFRVKFDKYTGNGKYIAFAADFDEQLLFFVDEVTVGSQKELARPVDIKVKDFTPTTVVVEPALINATAWNLIVSDVKTDDVDKLKPANILFKGENIPASVKDTLVTLTNMEGKWIRVYVQAVNGEDKSEWSYAQKYMMPNSLSSAALPKVYDFEAKPTYSY